MTTFLAAVDGVEIPAHTCSSLARTLARKDPLRAMDWTGRLPESRRIAAGSDAFSEWQRTQPEPAWQWLNSLLASDARRDPFFQSAVRNLAYESYGAERLAGLSAADRGPTRKVIEDMQMPNDREARLLDALR